MYVCIYHLSIYLSIQLSCWTQVWGFKFYTLVFDPFKSKTLLGSVRQGSTFIRSSVKSSFPDTSHWKTGHFPMNGLIQSWVLSYHCDKMPWSRQLIRESIKLGAHGSREGVHDHHGGECWGRQAILVLEQQLRGWDTANWEWQESLETSKSTPSDTPSPTRPHLHRALAIQGTLSSIYIVGRFSCLYRILGTLLGTAYWIFLWITLIS